MSASNIGCDDEKDWIQINPQLFSSFPPDSRYLVGVSGGRDSIVLLDRLLDLGYCKLIVCHLNHQLRGRKRLFIFKRDFRNILPAFGSTAGPATPTR